MSDRESRYDQGRWQRLIKRYRTLISHVWSSSSLRIDVIQSEVKTGHCLLHENGYCQHGSGTTKQMVKQDEQLHDEDLIVGDPCFCDDQPWWEVAGSAYDGSAHDGGDGGQPCACHHNML